MKKQLLILSILALTSLGLKADCGKPECVCNPCLCPPPCATPCCYPSSWYVATRGALTWRNDLDFNLGGGDTISTDTKLGGGANFALGYNFQCICMRFELEALYQRNSFKSFTLTSPSGDFAPFVGTYGVHGAIQDLGLMANLYYDFNLCSCLKFYLGAGVGVDFNRVSFGRTIVVDDPDVDPLVLDSAKNKTYFAWNAMAGFSYPITQCWFLDLGYRLWGTNKIKFNLDPGVSKSNTPLVQRAEAGFRYHF